MTLEPALFLASDALRHITKDGTGSANVPNLKMEMTAGVSEKYDKLIANGLTIEKRWGVPEDVGCAAAVLARGRIAVCNGTGVAYRWWMTILRL